MKRSQEPSAIPTRIVGEVLKREGVSDIRTRSLLRAMFELMEQAECYESLGAEHSETLLTAQLTVLEFAMSTHRHIHGADSTVDGIPWHARVCLDAKFVLESYSRLDAAQGSTIPQSVVALAACLYCENALKSPTVKQEDVESLLRQAGLGIYTTYIMFINASSPDVQAYDDVRNVVPIEPAKCIQGLSPELLSTAYAAMSDEMREDLLRYGYKLPNLEEDGTYGRKKDGTYRNPRARRRMLPRHKSG